MANKNLNKWANYSMDINSEMAEKIKSFVGAER